MVDNSNLDFESTTQYVLTVNATDGALNDTADITIDITPINDNAPVITSPNTTNVAENTTAVLPVIATDADLPGDTLTYAIAGGADGAFFNIDGSGNLSFNTAPDYEAPADADSNNDYVVDVSVSDGVNTTVQTLTVNVTDVADTSPPPGGTDDTGGGTDDGGNDSGDPGGSTPDPIEPPIVDDTPGIPPEGDWPLDPPIVVDDDPDSSEPADKKPDRESEKSTEFTSDLDSTPTISDGEVATPNPLTPVVDQEIFVKHLAKTIASLRESQPEPSEGFESVVNKIEDFAQAAPLLPPLELSGKLLDLIDVMKQEMSEADLSDEQFILVAGALGTTLTLTVGYVAWLLRIGYLATSLLSLTPMLIREFDPLLVLAKRRKRKQGDAQSGHDQIGDNDVAIDRLFDQNVYPKIEPNQLSKPS